MFINFDQILTTFSNLVGSETLAVTGSGTVSSGNVGTGKSITLGTLSLANGSGSASNYSLSNANLDITKRALTLIGSKIYDGNTTIQGNEITTFHLIKKDGSLFDTSITNKGHSKFSG